jgi:hypothetical protein
METKANVGAIALRVISANETEIVKAFKANNEVSNRWARLADKLYSEGLRAFMVDVKDEHKVAEGIAKLKEFAVTAFTAEEKKLYDADTKTLDEFGKFKKKKLQNTRDANVNKVKTHLKKLEDKEDGIAKSRTEKAQECLAQAIKHLENEEQAHYAISDFIKDIKAIAGKYPKA